VYQRVYVKPNELRFEVPYITPEHRADAGGLQAQERRGQTLLFRRNATYQSLQNNRETIDNIRLWDWRPLLDTYVQLQEIRTYYKFHDAGFGSLHAGRADTSR